MKTVFPVVKKGERCWPKDGKCPVCGKMLVDGDKVEQVVLTAGALRKVGPDEWTGFNDDLGGFLTLCTHSHSSKDASVDVMELAKGGQADLIFCSFGCARTFLGRMVDELEARWRKANGR